MAGKAEKYAKISESKQKCSNFCRQKSRYSSSESPADRMLQLQRTAGNQIVQRLIGSRTSQAKSRALQAKLRISQPNDIYEQEADRVAEGVMKMPDPVLRRKCTTCGKEEKKAFQAKESPAQFPGTRDHENPPLVHEVLQSPGRPLDPATRAFMEPLFGYDFSRVRVHSGGAAERSAQDLNAHAYTVGHNIVFDAGRLAPSTYEGQRLIAHELMHVVQQSSSGQVKPAFIDRSSDHFERQADNVSTAIMNLRLSQTGVQPAMVKILANPSMLSGVIQRKPAPDAKPVRENRARLDRLARDPREAHRAWKGLNIQDRFIILDSMARRYGAAFADQFREVAQRGKPDFSVTYWQPRSGPTPEQLRAGGWGFLGMEFTGNAAFDVELWVNPSGKTIRRDVSTYRPGQPEKGEEIPDKLPPTEKKEDMPPIEDCTELKEMTLAILRDTISTENAAKTDLEGEKGRLEKMNKTTDDYCQRYDEYIQSLRAMKTRVDTAVDDIETMRKQLVEAKCSVDIIDSELQELTDLQIWVDIESGPMGTQFLECIRIRPPINLPEDEE
ncbi:DUF4157 domain-containing protein [Methanosarcina sp.]|uniref:eCIS core domain-containing protein n=1 Tax=Methanosarcina sp. TaxID=2213 RepID=UPI002ABBA14D|nr:DUF4157 domain-containing protein [Methanosarcina sp.]MDY9927086.1 DUF4157 domain-containing protein [Methanosarcina sp.]